MDIQYTSTLKNAAHRAVIARNTAFAQEDSMFAPVNIHSPYSNIKTSLLREDEACRALLHSAKSRKRTLDDVDSLVTPCEKPVNGIENSIIKKIFLQWRKVTTCVQNRRSWKLHIVVRPSYAVAKLERGGISLRLGKAIRTGKPL